MRTEIVVSLAAVTPSSLEEVTQVSSAVEASTRQADELSVHSQLVLASSIKVIANKLKAHAELDESNDNRLVESTAEDIWASLSRTLKASVDAATIPDVSLLVRIISCCLAVVSVVFVLCIVNASVVCVQDYLLISNASTTQTRRRRRRALDIDEVVGVSLMLD